MVAGVKFSPTLQPRSDTLLSKHFKRKTNIYEHYFTEKDGICIFIGTALAAGRFFKMFHRIFFYGKSHDENFLNQNEN